MAPRRPLVTALAILLAAATAGASRASAQAAVDVLGNSGDYTFAERLTFDLEAAAPQAIEDVVLHYTVGGEGPRNRRIPEFTPGTRVEAHHEEVLARGQIPPAALVTWWWTLTDDEGAELETPPETIRYLDESFAWRSNDGDDVRVWWYDADAAFADQTADQARAALARLGRVIGTLPDRRIEIVTYQSREDMLPALIARGDVYEERLATLGARVAPDTLLLLAGADNPEVEDVLNHELSHVVLNLHFPHDYIDAPLWLDEGLAMYNEGPLEGDEQEDLDEAVREDTLMSVRSLTSFPGEAELVPLAYAESRDIVAFLLDTHGEEKFRDLLDRYGTGEVTMDQALQAVYDLDQLSLYQAYRAERGLPPANPPAADAVGPSRRARTRDDSRGGVCAGAALALPALALAVGMRRRGRRAGDAGA